MSPLLLLAGGYEGKVLTLSFDPSATPPTLSITSTTPCGIAPTWLTLSPTAPVVYVADEWGAGPSVLTSHTISPTGALSLTSSARTGADDDDHWPCHTAILTSAEPHRHLTTTYKGCAISSIPLLPTGEFDESGQSGGRQTISFVETGTKGPLAWRQDQDHPHGAHIDPTGSFVIVPDLGTDCLKVLRVNEAGDLVRGPDVQLEAGDGPRHAIFSVLSSTKKTILYILNELHNSLSIYEVTYPTSDSTSLFPSFTLLQSRLSLLPPQPHPHQTDFSSWHAAELKISHDGTTLIASNRAENHDPESAVPDGPGEEDLLALFDVDATSGKLIEGSRRLVGSGGRAPRHFALSSERAGWVAADNEFVAVALHDSDEVVIFELMDGELKEVVRKKGAGKPACVLFLN
ncbi:hypothetical protein RQP46_009733 [Phenoliferia psychrophenolica]